MDALMLECLDAGHLPLERTKFRKPPVIPLVRSEHPNASPTCAGSNERVVGQTPLSDFLVTIFTRQERQHPASSSPVAEVWHQDSFCAVEVSLQSLYDAPLTVGGASVEFLKHH